MKKIKLVVKTSSKNYPIIIGSNIIKNISSIIQTNNIKFNKCLIVADKKVPKKNLSILKKKFHVKQNPFTYLILVKKIKTKQV